MSRVGPLRHAVLAWVCGVLLLVGSGCTSGGFTGLYALPLPGGADLGDAPYRVVVEFDDVLDLVPQAGVKVNDVPVGRVERIELSEDGRTALVTVAVNASVRLPANAVARLRQSSLLGEKYVELAEPDGASASDRLADGAVIPVARTNRNPEVEEVFGALSLLLNGGGIGQIQDITRELNKALAGNESDIRAFLSNLDTLVSDLDTHRGEITRALDGLNRLSATLAGRRDQIGNVLDNLAPGLRVLSDQRGQLVTMLRTLDTLSTVAVDTVNRSRDDLVADLTALAPTLEQLAESGENLPQALEILFTYPFTDAALDGVKGDYLNLYLSLTTGGSAQPGPDQPTGQRDAPVALPLPAIGPAGSVHTSAGGR